MTAVIAECSDPPPQAAGGIAEAAGHNGAGGHNKTA